MSPLAELKCEACRGDGPVLTEAEVLEMLREVPEWRVVDRGGMRHLERVFKFSDFAEAIQFTDRVAEAAEQADHHPSLLTEWGRVTVTWWTHKVKGLHRNDFIMAARTDELYESP
jgi:4a-hydroxytetrahydrobiopterin dehydratase